MKRRTFIKLLAGFLSMGTLPVLAKPKTIAFDGKKDYLKADTFALNEPQTIYFLHKSESPTVVGNPIMEENVCLLDVSGNGNHLTRIFDGKKSRLIDHSEFINQHNVFAPNDLPNITMWQGFETDEHGVTRYIDKLTGEDLSENIKRFNGDIKIPE